MHRSLAAQHTRALFTIEERATASQPGMGYAGARLWTGKSQERYCLRRRGLATGGAESSRGINSEHVEA